MKMGETFDQTVQSVQPLTYNHSPCNQPCGLQSSNRRGKTAKEVT